MTLEEMLKRDTAGNLTVINQKANLSRRVGAIESTENPDVFPYLELNSIVITTAMVYKNDAEGLCEFITKLNEVPCAALAIKVGRYLDDVAPEVIDTADSLEFPIIRIPMSDTLGYTYRRLLAILWNVQNYELLDAMEVKRNLHKQFLNGITFRRMLHVVSELLKRHILIFDTISGEIRENGISTGEERKQALEVLNRMKTADALGQISEYKDGSKMIVYPIRFIRGNMYLLVVFDEKPKKSVFVMEEIILMMGTMLYKNLFTVYNEIRKKDEFLRQLVDISEDGWSAEKVMEAGKEYGLRGDGSYQMIIGRFLQFDKYRFNSSQFAHREEKYISVYEALREKMKKLYYNKVVFLGDAENWQYILLQQGTCEGIAEVLQDIADRIETVLQEKIVFIFGATCTTLRETIMSYWEIKNNLNFRGGVAGKVRLSPISRRAYQSFSRKFPIPAVRRSAESS